MADYRTIGILGGMGPMATYDLGRKILAHTEASCDQEHIPVLIDCNTRIADRTEAILRGGSDPLPEMIRSAKRLEAMGADLLAMPCNTAHYYYEKIAGAVEIPVLHMPGITAEVLASSGVRCDGVLATDGTRESGVYETALAARGIRTVYPAPEHQKTLMRMIYEHVKAGNLDFSGLDTEGLSADLAAKGAEILILGCTELPIAFERIGETGLPRIDPTEMLARAAVQAAGGRLK